jgi:hypothetical protein
MMKKQWTAPPSTNCCKKSPGRRSLLSGDVPRKAGKSFCYISLLGQTTIPKSCGWRSSI